MLKQPDRKYRPFAPVDLKDRNWPDAVPARAPLWLSTCVIDYHPHALDAGADAQTAAYLEPRVDEAQTLSGVGIDGVIISASLKAVVSGVERTRSRGAYRAQSALAVA